MDTRTLILGALALLVVGNAVFAILNARIGNWAGAVPGMIGVVAGVIGAFAMAAP